MVFLKVSKLCIYNGESRKDFFQVVEDININAKPHWQNQLSEQKYNI
jgi:hypothetical protein